MAMVNNLTNVKDSRWLQIEVCREYQRNKCSRPDTECKFAHPSANIEIQNGRVIACYDSIKGRCNREKPPCKYFHPPQHLKDELLINGRNHLALKNALLQQMPLQTVLTAGQLPLVGGSNAVGLLSMCANGLTSPAAFAHQLASQQRAQAAALATANFLNGSVNLSPSSTSTKANSHYVTNLPAVASASAYGTFSPAVIPGLMSTADQLTSTYGIVPAPAAFIASHKQARTDRLEVCREFQRGNCKRAESECRFAHPPEHVDATDGVVTVCMDFIKGRCSREQCRYFHPPLHLQAQLKTVQNRPNVTALPSASHVLTETASSLAAGKKRIREPEEVFMTLPGVVPLTKRPAMEKSGIPMYQPNMSAYQQALAVHQSFVPLSFTGHHPSVPRF